VLAFVMLTILPAVIVFFAAQKHIISGLTAGAVKG
jgi:raffinose/stachyose/melibiose transport system permease protein